MKKIKVYTNLVYGGWNAKQLESGIGGSEEKLIEWAKEMAKENDVTIYMNGEHGDFDNVHYRDHREFKVWEPCDVFISFKNSTILTQSINAEKIFHWTTEVEPQWSKAMLNSVDSVLCISDYHRSRMRPQSDKFRTMYLWADFNRIGKVFTESIEDKSKAFIEREKGSMLYSSSFDRGLEELLTNWDLVKEKLGVKKLYITYGWDFMVNLIKANPHLEPWKLKMEELMKQEGVEYIGKLSNDEMCKMYWRCEYWCLPLNNPDSELFCINAIKSQYAGCIPVVRKIGALQETVNDCINWEELIGRPNQKSTFKEGSIEQNRKFAKQFSLDLKIKEWKELIK